MIDQKKIFISYSWDSPKHKAWVKKFSDDLQARLGRRYLVLLDQNQKRNSLSRFIKNGLKDAEIVLIIGTPNYKSKSEKSGGVAYETMLITNEMLKNMDTTKFYPILRSGTFETSFPTEIKDRIGDDFSDDNYYDENLQIVVNEIFKDYPISKAVEQEPTPINNSSTEGAKNTTITNESIGLRTRNTIDIRQCIILDSTLSDAYKKLCILKLMMNNPSEALNNIDKAIRLKDNRPDTYYYRGLIRYNLERKEVALADINKAIELNPYYAEAYYIRGLLKFEFGKTADAIKDIINARNFMSNVVETYPNRNYLKGRMKDIDNSINGVIYSMGMTKLIRVPRNKKGSFLILSCVTDIGIFAFEGCKQITSIVVSDSVTKIGKRLFYGCSNLTSIKIPNSIAEIGDSAFSCCISLNSIKIPDRVTEIRDSTFFDCSKITSIKITSSVTKIGTWAFRGCTNLTSIKIPDNVKKIGDGAFAFCFNLNSIEISSSVSEFGNIAFEGCKCLEEIHLKHKNPIDFSNAFWGLAFNKISLFVPKGSTGTYRNHRLYQRFKNIIEE